MFTSRHPRRSPGPVLASLAVLALAAAPLRAGILDRLPEEREISMTAEREASVRSEVERALEVALGERVKSVSLGLGRPALWRRGDRFELHFEKGTIGLTEMDVGGISVNGIVRFEDLVLDYAELGVGKFRLLEDPQVYPDLSTTLLELEAFMDKQGLRDTFIRYDEEAQELVLGGRRPVQILFVRMTPLVTVRGNFALDDNKVAFKIRDIDVKDANGTVASAVRRRVHEIASRTVDLDEVLAGLVVKGIRLGGGSVRVESGHGLFFAHKLPAIGFGTAGAE